MKDRVPLYPGRVKLVPVSGQANTYDMKREDQPTQVGDPLNKNTLLKDETAALFGLSSNAVPDDVLSLLGQLLAKEHIVIGTYTGTGEVGSAHPHSLRFDSDFAPKLILIRSQNGHFGGGEMTLIQGVPYGFTSFWNGAAVDSISVNAYWDGNTVTWYWGGNGYYDSIEVQSKMECNKSATTYYYIAIG